MCVFICFLYLLTYCILAYIPIYIFLFIRVLTVCYELCKLKWVSTQAFMALYLHNRTEIIWQYGSMINRWLNVSLTQRDVTSLWLSLNLKYNITQLSCSATNVRTYVHTCLCTYWCENMCVPNAHLWELHKKYIITVPSTNCRAFNINKRVLSRDSNKLDN